MPIHLPILDSGRMSSQPTLFVPPVADPGSYPGTSGLAGSSLPAPLGLSLAQMKGQLLSVVLMFLQEVLLEYEETATDWRTNDQDIALMLSVRAKLGASVGSNTPPAFTTQELEYIDAILVEYTETHNDWRRHYFYEPYGVEFDDFADFYLMLTAEQAVGDDEITGTTPPSGGSGSGSGSGSGISTPPPADPYYPQTQ